MTSAAGTDDGSELGLEIDQIPDDDSASEDGGNTQQQLAVWAVLNAYKAITGEEPPGEMEYPLTAVSWFLGIVMDEEMFEVPKTKYGSTHATGSKGTSTQTPPQPVLTRPTRRDVATDPRPATPAGTYATAATEAAPLDRIYARVATKASAPAAPGPTTNSASTSTDSPVSSRRTTRIRKLRIQGGGEERMVKE